MNFLSYSLLFFITEMKIFCAERTDTRPNVIRIPLTTASEKFEKQNSRVARSKIFLQDAGRIHFGTIAIGNDPKRNLFRVLFDTGSRILWVLSSAYDSCEPNAEALSKHTLYNRSNSPTNVFDRDEKPELLKYTKGWALGLWSTDEITIGNQRLENRRFVEITTADNSFMNAKYDGIMGLNYDPIKGNIITTFCELSKGENKFSFYFPKHVSSGNNAELLLCGEDTSKYVAGTMKYVNETTPGSWTITIDSIRMEDAETNVELASHAKLKIDSGSNLFNGPREVMEKILELTKSQLVENNTYAQQVHCHTVHLLPNLTFVIDGTNFTLTGEDYIQKIQNDAICILPFRKRQHYNTYYNVGYYFMRKFYTVYDMKNHRLGIANNIA